MDKVSVIVPIYNTSKYLNECLESIANQTYQNIEVIMINDGSTDNSAEICKEFEKKDKRFKLINKENGGVSSARNVGLQECEGELVSFVDSDDKIKENFIEKLVSLLNINNADIAACDFLTKNKKENINFVNGVFRDNEIMLEFLNNGMYNRITNKIYKYELIKNITFPKDRCIMEDAIWTALVLEKSKCVARTAEANYIYRISKKSLSHKTCSELEKCGEYRNRIEKLIVLQRHSLPDSGKLKFESMLIQVIRDCLASRYNLTYFDVYLFLNKAIENDKENLKENPLCKLVIDNKDYKDAQEAYLRYLIKIEKSPKQILKYFLKRF